MTSPQVKFIDEENLQLENLPDGREDMLLRPFHAGVRFSPNDHRTFVVPIGFVTDWASVPRIFWRIIPVRGAYNKAALLHDYLYRHQPAGVTRKQADLIFLDTMRFLGVPGPERWLMFQAVRLGGWLPWKRNAAKKAKREG